MLIIDSIKSASKYFALHLECKFTLAKRYYCPHIICMDWPDPSFDGCHQTKFCKYVCLCAGKLRYLKEIIPDFLTSSKIRDWI